MAQQRGRRVAGAGRRIAEPGRRIAGNGRRIAEPAPPRAAEPTPPRAMVGRRIAEATPPPAIERAPEGGRRIAEPDETGAAKPSRARRIASRGARVVARPSIVPAAAVTVCALVAAVAAGPSAVGPAGAVTVISPDHSVTATAPLAADTASIDVQVFGHDTTASAPMLDEIPTKSRGGKNESADDVVGPTAEEVSRSGQREPQAPPLPDWLEACNTESQAIDGDNGQLPDEALCDLPNGYALRGDAAKAWWQLSQEYEATFDREPCMISGYRSLSNQYRVAATRPGRAARPGTSNHGWGIAIDVCGGAGSFGTAENGWLQENGPAFGWVNPDWAQPGGSLPEPWHWEFTGGLPETP